MMFNLLAASPTEITSDQVGFAVAVSVKYFGDFWIFKILEIGDPMCLS
jgi:hypothetical protein